MDVSRQIQKSKTEYKEKQKKEQIQKENSGRYDCLIIDSETLDGELHLTLQSEFGVHNIKFAICDNSRESGKSASIERLEDRTQSNVKYPESFIGKEAIIKNIYKTKNSFIIFESNKEEYTRKLWINKVNRYGSCDNQDILELNHFLFSFGYIVITLGSFAIFDILFSIILPLYTIFIFGILLISYLFLVTLLHQRYEPIIKQIDYPYKDI